MATEALGAFYRSLGGGIGGGFGLLSPIELAHTRSLGEWILGMAWEVRSKVRPNPDKKRFLETRRGQFSAFGPNFSVRIGVLGMLVEMLLNTLISNFLR